MVERFPHPVARGQGEGRQAIFVHGVHFGPELHQPVQHRRLAVPRREMQRRVAVPVLLLQHQLAHLLTALRRITVPKPPFPSAFRFLQDEVEHLRVVLTAPDASPPRPRPRVTDRAQINHRFLK